MQVDTVQSSFVLFTCSKPYNRNLVDVTALVHHILFVVNIDYHCDIIVRINSEVIE